MQKVGQLGDARGLGLSRSEQDWVQQRPDQGFKQKKKGTTLTRSNQSVVVVIVFVGW